MSTMSHPAETTNKMALWALLLGNFIIGTGVLLPTGLLNALSEDFAISPARAGLMALVGGVVVAIGAPLVANFTSAIDRRKLLTFALLLYAAGHLVSTMIPEFVPLLYVRGITVLGAAIFTPQAAATAGLLVPLEKRAGAIAFIFIGWSAASVVGIPLGNYFAEVVGWRWVFGAMAIASTLSAILVWAVLQPGLFVSSLNLAAWKQALTNPVILTTLLVTVLAMSGQFTVFTYIAPIFREAFSAGVAEISLAFAVAGITGIAGNAIASRVVQKLGIDYVIAIAIVGLITGIAIFALSFGNIYFAMIGIAIWGLGSFSSNSLQQSRLVAIAPSLAAATVALNTSVVYVGQAVGAGIGGWYLEQAVSPAIAWTASALTALALIASIAATRLSQKT